MPVIAIPRAAIPKKTEYPQESEPAQDRAQDHAAEAGQVITRAPWMFGVLLGATDPQGRTSGPIRIASAGDKVTLQHGLQRAPRGWRLERLQAAPGMYPVLIETAASLYTITFQASAACWALFWVW